MTFEPILNPTVDQRRDAIANAMRIASTPQGLNWLIASHANPGKYNTSKFQRCVLAVIKRAQNPNKIR